MKRAFPISATLLSCAALFAGEKTGDRVAEWNRANCTSNAVVSSKGKVRFLAQAAGVDANATVEFAVCSLSSEKDYETLFIALSDAADVCKALEASGAAPGVPPDNLSARFWPTGTGLKFFAINTTTGKTNSLEDCITINKSFLPEAEADSFTFDSVVYTGGQRTGNNSRTASEDSSGAIFALYSMPQAPLLLQFPLDQSSTYGAFRAKSKMPKDDLYEIVLEIKDGAPSTTQNALILPDGTVTLPAGEKIPLAEFIEKSKNANKTGTHGKQLTTFAFDRKVELYNAVKAAGILLACNGSVLSINGNAPGQIPLEAYLPDEKWRDRTKRPMQPIEIRLGEKKTVTCIDEDWSKEGLEPAISTRSAGFNNAADLSKAVSSLGKNTASANVFFIYAPEKTFIGEILDTAKAADDGRSIFYVFAENKKQPE